MYLMMYSFPLAVCSPHSEVPNTYKVESKRAHGAVCSPHSEVPNTRRETHHRTFPAVCSLHSEVPNTSKRGNASDSIFKELCEWKYPSHQGQTAAPKRFFYVLVESTFSR